MNLVHLLEVNNFKMNTLEDQIAKGIKKYLEENDFQLFPPNLLENQTQLELASYIRKEIQLYLTGKKS